MRYRSRGTLGHLITVNAVPNIPVLYNVVFLKRNTLYTAHARHVCCFHGDMFLYCGSYFIYAAGCSECMCVVTSGERYSVRSTLLLRSTQIPTIHIL